jgi:hypothetical protein
MNVALNIAMNVTMLSTAAVAVSVVYVMGVVVRHTTIITPAERFWEVRRESVFAPVTPKFPHPPFPEGQKVVKGEAQATLRRSSGKLLSQAID